MWSTEAQALTYTGKTVTDEELAMAGGIITIYAGVTPDQPEASITARDRVWLAMAEAYQAVWMRGKPDITEVRESHTSTSADGVSVQRESDSQIMLAPLAARTLKNLSWVGGRSVQTYPTADLPKGSFLQEEADAFHSWTPRPIA